MEVKTRKKKEPRPANTAKSVLEPRFLFVKNFMNYSKNEKNILFFLENSGIMNYEKIKKKKRPQASRKLGTFEMPCAGRVLPIPFQLVNAFNVLYCSTFRINFQVDCTLSSKSRCSPLFCFFNPEPWQIISQDKQLTTLTACADLYITITWESNVLFAGRLAASNPF